MKSTQPNAASSSALSSHAPVQDGQIEPSHVLASTRSGALPVPRVLPRSPKEALQKQPASQNPSLEDESLPEDEVAQVAAAQEQTWSALPLTQGEDVVLAQAETVTTPSAVTSTSTTTEAAATTGFSGMSFPAMLAVGGGVLALAGGGKKSSDAPAAPGALFSGGTVTLGKAAAGLKVQALDTDNTVVAEAETDSNGQYKLQIASKYAGKVLTLQVSDPDPLDGKGYIDEATGESKDLVTPIRAKFVVDGKATSEAAAQKAQITPLTELAARKAETIADFGTLTDAQKAAAVNSANQAVGKLFGLSNVVNTDAPVVVTGGSTGGTSANSGDAYGQALALLSGMDNIQESQGSTNATDATLDVLAAAITLTVGGSVEATFNGADANALNLLAQAVAQVTTQNSTDATQSSDLQTNLTHVAQGLLSSGNAATTVAVFMSANNAVLGANKTTTLNFAFETAPTDAQLAAFKNALRANGGSLSEPVSKGGDNTVYTATFTQAGDAEPKVWLADAAEVQFFANDVLMQYDSTSPVLSVSRIVGVDANGAATQVVNGGDTVRVVLSAPESVKVTGTPTVQLDVGGVAVDARYVPSASGGKTLVFEYLVPSTSQLNADVTVMSANFGSAVQDFAGNAASLDPAYRGLSLTADTTAPTVLAQVPLDAATVGNAGVPSLTLTFSEPVVLGRGNLTLSKIASAGATPSVVQTLDLTKGQVSADGFSVSFALSTENSVVSTLAAGDYTVSASSGSFTDRAGNALSGGLAADGVWNFSVGAVTLGINKVSGDNLLKASELQQALSLSGTVAGAADVLSSLTPDDLQVWLRPIAGGDAVQATTLSLAGEAGTWEASLSQADAARLAGGYVVQAFINTSSVKSSASSVIVVDTAAHMAVGTIAGDDRLSLLEQSILSSGSGRSLTVPFAAEMGASGSITFTNAADASKTVSKTFTNATGAASNVTLTAEELASLGRGNITVQGSVTDLAGNTATVSKILVVDAVATPAAVTGVTVVGSRTGALGVGDTLTATVRFDKAVQLAGVENMGFNLLVGSTPRTAVFSQQSTDRKSISFSYTVQSEEVDADGVSFTADALSLGTDSRIVDVATATTLASTSFPLSLVAQSSGLPTVNAAASAFVPDQAVSVTEAGLSPEGLVLPGTAQAAGRLLASGALEKVQVAGADAAVNLSAPTSNAASLGAVQVIGKYGTWLVGGDGSYQYLLNNADVDTQALGAGSSATDVLNYWVSGQPSPQQLTVTVRGTNDGPVVTAALSQAASAGATSSVSLNLLQNASDVEGDTLGVSALRYSVGGVPTGATLPTGLSLGADGTSLTLDPTNTAFKSLRAGATQTLTANFAIDDGHGGRVAQTASFTVTGVNDAPSAVGSVAAQTATAGQFFSLATSGLFADADLGDTRSYSLSGEGATGLSIDANGRITGAPSQHAAQEVRVTMTDGSGATASQTFTLAVNSAIANTAPTASTVTGEAPGAFDRGALTGPKADTLMVRFSESVNADLLEAALAQGKLSLQGPNGEARNLGTGAVFEAFSPSSLVVSGFGEAANGTYTSLWNPATARNTEVPAFALGFGLSNPNNFTVDNTTTIYKKTNANGDIWYIWRQEGWSTYIISQTNPLDANNQARTWYLASTTNSSDPAVRTGVLGVAGWSAKSGALVANTDPWSGTSRLATADVEPNGWGRTFVLALGTGNTAQGGDTLVIDKDVVKDTQGAFASANVSFTLPADITRPAPSSSTRALVQGLDASGNLKTTALGVGDKVRVTLTMDELVTVSSNTNPSVTLQLDNNVTRKASLNRSLSFANGAASSSALVFEYTVQSGDSDVQGGITVGPYNRNNSNVLDLSKNRMNPLADIAEASNTVAIGSTASPSPVDTQAPNLWVSYASGDKVVLSANEVLKSTALPSASAFSVQVGGQSVAVQSVALSPDGAAVVLTLVNAVNSGQTVQASYTAPTGATALQDLAGNVAASFSNTMGFVFAATAPNIQFAQADRNTIQLAGEDGGELWFTVKFSNSVNISGTPRLVLQLGDGQSSPTTVYADFEAYSGVSAYGQTSASFVYRPPAGTQGQVHVSNLDLNGGVISASGTGGLVAANVALSGTEFFSPNTWIYPQLRKGTDGLLGGAGNDLLAPWFDAPESTPRTLTSTTVQGGAGSRDVLVMTVMLPATVTTREQADTYNLVYNVTADGTRQVLLKNSSGAVVDTYTVPTDANWPTDVEQLFFVPVYRTSDGGLDVGGGDNNINMLLTRSTAEYVDPVNSNDRWLQGSLGNDTLNVSSAATAQRIFLEGAQGNDTLVGHDGVDILRGGGGTNTLSAGAGNDIVIVSNGVGDLVDGGTGNDTLRFDLPGGEKRVLVDAAGMLHVYSGTTTTTTTWVNGVATVESTGLIERYRLSSDYGSDGSNRLGVFDVQLNRVVASVKNIEQVQWRMANNFDNRVNSTLAVGTAGADTLNAADVVLAGAGDDTIALSSPLSNAYNAVLAIDGGTGRDTLVLNSYANGSLSNGFSVYGSDTSRSIKNIEGLTLNAGGNWQLAAADIAGLYAPAASGGLNNTNAWAEVLTGAGKQQFLINSINSNGSLTSNLLNLTDSTGWTQQPNSVTFNNNTFNVYDHSSGVELIVNQAVTVSGGGLGGSGGSGSGSSGTTSVSVSSNTNGGYITEGSSGGTTPVLFNITRSGSLSSASTVDWSLVNTSTDTSDFASGQATSGTVSFAANESSKTVTIQVQADSVSEPNESFSVRLSNPSNGSVLSQTQTSVTILNDDGGNSGGGSGSGPITATAPVVTLVRALSREVVAAGDELRFVVELDQQVTVQGTPRLELVLSNALNETKTVYADFRPYSDSTNGTWNQQSTLTFQYDYTSADATGPGWTYHINGLVNQSGSSITSVENGSYGLAANLTLNNVGLTAGTWLYTSVPTTAQGSANNDLQVPFMTAGSASLKTVSALAATGVDGGAGDRDVLVVPVWLPSSVTTLTAADNYYLRYEVTGSASAPVRKVNLYQTGSLTVVDSYEVPVGTSAWPTNVEGLAYVPRFVNSSGSVQELTQPNGAVLLWKDGYTGVDAVSGDVVRQGSYLSDTIDLSTTATNTRVLVRGAQGNDTITGHAGTDVVNGDGGNDVINAGDGNDLVFLSAGTDTLNGGAGVDVLAMWLQGQEGRPWVDTATGKLQVQSGVGHSDSVGFVVDSAGWHTDWVLDFDGTTGAILAQQAGSTSVTTATSFEKARLYKDPNDQLLGETTDIFEIGVGTAGNDTLIPTADQGILAGLNGDDVFNLNSDQRPVMMGGNGSDVFLFSLAGFGMGSSDLQLHGGAGTDTVRLGADVADVTLYRPSSDGFQATSIEVIDLTGSTVAGALGNTLTLSAVWMRELVDAGGSLKVDGDANDRVQLPAGDTWTLASSSDQPGYAQYQASYQNQNFNVYVANAIYNASGVLVI